MSGCGASGGRHAAGGPPRGETPRGGDWARDRLLGARPLRDWATPALAPGATPSAPPPLVDTPRVGALFAHDASGDHFCTASVVASPQHDLLITAAHCIHG